VDPAAVAIVGTSYGGYLAAIATQLRPVSFLVLRAPAIYRDIDWRQAKLELHQDPELLVYRSRVVLWDDNKALRACAAFRGDALIVQSEHDDIVPGAVIESYARAFTHARSATRRLLAGADHGLAEERHRYEYELLLMNWLGDTVLARPRAEASDRSAH
jgi:pimeloyl-ACP methyl ester carboxylesterase